MSSEKTKTVRRSADPMVMNVAQMAALVGVSSVTVSAWITDEGAPCLTRGGRGVSFEIHAPTFIRWWGERLRQQASEGISNDQLRKRRELAEVETAELKLSQMRQENIPRILAMFWARDLLTRLRTSLDQMSAREADTVVGLRSRREAEEALQLIRDALCAELRSPDFFRAPENISEQLSLHG